MRTIDIDLDVHKKIEAARTSLSQTENSILRSLLNIGPLESKDDTMRENGGTKPGLLARGTLIPDGTELRSTLRGTVHRAKVRNGKIEFNGEEYHTPSAAGCEATGYNTNGWVFWEYKDEVTGRWHKLDRLRKLNAI